MGLKPKLFMTPTCEIMSGDAYTSGGCIGYCFYYACPHYCIISYCTYV